MNYIIDILAFFIFILSICLITCTNKIKIIIVIIFLISVISILYKNKEAFAPDITPITSKYLFDKTAVDLVINNLFNKNNIRLNQVNFDNLTVSKKTTQLEALYPVGSIIILYNNKTPQKEGLPGEWSQIEAGRVLATSGKFNGNDVVNEDIKAADTYGSENVKLIESDIANHCHNISAETVFGNGKNGSKNKFAISYNWYNNNHKVTKVNSDDKFAQWKTYNTLDETGKSTPNNNEHNNMPPYLLVYVWKRTK